MDGDNIRDDKKKTNDRYPHLCKCISGPRLSNLMCAVKELNKTNILG